jgi:hypothetical protein
MSRARPAATPLAFCALAVAGCGGGGGVAATPQALRLQREDLIAVARTLRQVEPSVDAEVAATRAAWPLIANGLAPATATAPIMAAAQSAARLATPARLGEAQAASLTGPAAQLAGLYHAYSRLAETGWRLIESSLGQMRGGSPSAARFARQNVALYIESVYDAHFDLGQIGRKLLAGYAKLGGPAAFAGALTQAEADALAANYSKARDQLHPHVGVRLGS